MEEKKCWICGRNWKETNQVVEDGFWDKTKDDGDWTIEIGPIDSTKVEYHLSNGFLKKGSKLYVCQVCWATIAEIFKDEFTHVIDAIEESLPAGLAEGLISSLESEGFPRRN